MLKDLARQMTPPIAWSGLRSIRRSVLPEKPQFYAEGELFFKAADGIRVYHEYGVGASTIWIDSYTDARIVSVDTSPEWIGKTTAALTRKGHSLSAVDVGPLGSWGMPVGFSRIENFPEYVEGPWREGTDADLVLIDGRFRISCFLNSLLRAKAGTRIIFDDYHRPAYHVVEEFVRPVEKTGRQALFVVPDRLDERSVSAARDKFILVRD